MLFNSLDYLLFMLLAWVVYWALWRRNLLRLAFLATASCLFYMAWHPAYILLLLASTGLDFCAGLGMARSQRKAVRRAWLGASLAGNLGMLFTFKYFDFFSATLTQALHLLGIKGSTPQLHLLLPAGISFYTFQTLAYSIDVYRRRLQPCTSPLQFLCFTSFFPQLVAGPIVRASQLLPQLAVRPQLNIAGVGQGLFLIGTGLVKKVAIADYLSLNLVDRVFDSPEAYSASEVVVALYGFTMQLYCDFSGYTDVARGSAKLLGIELPENFDRPYQASSPAEFWRRWHMTLSGWIRDYLYYPLGGSRVPPLRAYANLWLTLFVIGIWHGASPTFALYGALQGFAMVLHRGWHRRRGGHAQPTPTAWPWQALKVFACLQFVVFSRILFRAVDLRNAWQVTQRLFSRTVSVAQVAPSLWALLACSYLAHYLPRAWFHRLEQRFIALPAAAQGLLCVALLALLRRVASAQVVPYIYWQF